jgi:hypothetical protein
MKQIPTQRATSGRHSTSLSLDLNVDEASAPSARTSPPLPRGRRGRRFFLRWCFILGIDAVVVGVSLLFFIRFLSPMFDLGGKSSVSLMALEFTTLIELLGLPLCALILGGIILVYIAIFWCFTSASIGRNLQKISSPKN